MKKLISMLAITTLSLLSHNPLSAAFDHEDQSNEYDLYDRNLDNADFNKDDYPRQQVSRDNSSGPYQPQRQEYRLKNTSTSNNEYNFGSTSVDGSYNHDSGSYNRYYQNNGSYNYNLDSYRYQNAPSIESNETTLDEISNDRSNEPLQSQNYNNTQPTRKDPIAMRDSEYNLYDRNRDGADWNRNDYPNSNNSNYLYNPQ